MRDGAEDASTDPFALVYSACQAVLVRQFRIQQQQQWYGTSLVHAPALCFDLCVNEQERDGVRSGE